MAVERNMGVQAVLVALTLVTWICPVSSYAQCAAGELGGVVFRDFNSDGQQGTYEPGFGSAGMTVTASIDGGSSLASTTVNNDGTYSLGAVSIPAGGVRVTLSALPSYLKNGATGSDSNTSVRFVTSLGCNVDFGVGNPSEHCSTAPSIITSCFQSGSGIANTGAAIVSFPYSASGKPAMFAGSGPNPSMDADIQSIGSVWGAALQRSTQRVFFASATHRHIGFGPEGIGGVYVMDYSSGTGTLTGSFTLEGVTPSNGGGAISLGSVTRTNVGGAVSGVNEMPQSATQRSIDLDAYDKTGKTAYGDIAISEDDSTLWLVNLATVSLISVDVSGSTASLPGTVRSTLISSMPGVPSCTNGTFRPWAISFHDGRGYLGGVCSAESGGTSANLDGYVLSFDPSNLATGFTTVLTIDLDYTREYTAWPTEIATWHPWNSDFTTLGIAYTSPPERFPGYAQPIFSNIKFTESGSMVLGLADRFGNQMGFRQYPPTVTAIADTGGAGITSITGGDILFACRSGTNWVMEGGSGCSVNENGATPGRSRSIVDGPSGAGEYFFQDNYYRNGFGDNQNTDHDETSQGGVVVVPGTGRVINGSLDPYNNQSTTEWFTGGFHWYVTADGTYEKGFILSPNPLIYPGYLGKASGLGEPEALCAPAPIEIGNRVWVDTNRDGQQDPSEVVLSGVTIELLDADNSDAIVGTVVTNGNGNYIFGGASDANLVGGYHLLPSRHYRLRISTSDAALGGRVATSSLAGSSVTDSNGVVSGSYVETSVTTGGYGDNDHTLDFGFNDPATPVPTATATATPTVTPTATPTISVDRTNAALGVDGQGLALRDTVKRAIRAVFKDGRVNGCTAMSTTSRNSRLAAADSIYSSFWTQVWGLARNDSLQCSDATVTAGIAQLSDQIQQLRTVGRNALRLCPNGGSLRTVHSKRITTQVTAANSALTAFANVYPSCG